MQVIQPYISVPISALLQFNHFYGKKVPVLEIFSVYGKVLLVRVMQGCVPQILSPCRLISTCII